MKYLKLIVVVVTIVVIMHSPAMFSVSHSNRLDEVIWSA